MICFFVGRARGTGVVAEVGVPAVAVMGALGSVGVVDVPPAVGVVMEEGDASGGAPAGFEVDVGD